MDIIFVQFRAGNIHFFTNKRYACASIYQRSKFCLPIFNKQLLGLLISDVGLLRKKNITVLLILFIKNGSSFLEISNQLVFRITWLFLTITWPISVFVVTSETCMGSSNLRAYTLTYRNSNTQLVGGDFAQRNVPPNFYWVVYFIGGGT